MAAVTSCISRLSGSHSPPPKGPKAPAPVPNNNHRFTLSTITPSSLFSTSFQVSNLTSLIPTSLFTEKDFLHLEQPPPFDFLSLIELPS